MSTQIDEYYNISNEQSQNEQQFQTEPLITKELQKLSPQEMNTKFETLKIWNFLPIFFSELFFTFTRLTFF